MSIQQREYTVDDVWELSHNRKNDEIDYELIHGRLIEVTLPGGIQGKLTAKLAYFIGRFMDEHQMGVVTVETGYHPPDDRKTLLAPDVAFISKARMPDPFPEKYVPVMPDLAIEIMSPTDSLKDIREKAAIYLQNGTQLVWIVLPHERGVDVCRSSEGNRLNIEFVGSDGELSGESVLPEFTLKVSKLFPA